jgi:hypothetical protein
MLARNNKLWRLSCLYSLHVDFHGNAITVYLLFTFKLQTRWRGCLAVFPGGRQGANYESH